MDLLLETDMLRICFLSIFHFVFLVTTTCYDDLKVADMEEITEMMNLLS
jgi:hypothetical protein